MSDRAERLPEKAAGERLCQLLKQKGTATQPFRAGGFGVERNKKSNTSILCKQSRFVYACIDSLRFTNLRFGW